MTEFRVHALNADEGGCGFYRIKEPARVVDAQFDIDITVSPDLPCSATISRTGEVQFQDMLDTDVIIFQRPLLSTMTDAIRYAQGRGIACVVEIDDNLSRVHRDNIAYHAVDPRNNAEANYRHLEKACEIADWVTVSTPALARHYGKHGRVSVLRNCVPESIYEVQKRFNSSDAPAVGWTGTVQTHPGDLSVIGPHLGSVLRHRGGRFAVVGDGAGVREQFYLHSDVEVDATGWVDLSAYYRTVAGHIDIGIVPLEITDFNQGKSALKGLEMGALGIPFVASPTEEYLRMEQLGLGVTARKGIQWQKKLAKLIDDEQFRVDTAEAYRNVTKTMTYELHAEQWVEAWKKALAHRREITGNTYVHRRTTVVK